MPRNPTIRSNGEGSIYRSDYTLPKSGETVERHELNICETSRFAESRANELVRTHFGTAAGGRQRRCWIV